MQVEILESYDPAKLQNHINDWINDFAYDDNIIPLLEIVDIKYVSFYNPAEKEINYSAMILYKSI